MIKIVNQNSIYFKEVICGPFRALLWFNKPLETVPLFKVTSRITSDAHFSKVQIEGNPQSLQRGVKYEGFIHSFYCLKSKKHL